MSTLAKVFIVLLVVFSIAFTSMSVSMVAQTTNWRDTAEKYRENAQISATNLTHAHAVISATAATAWDELRTHLARIGGLEVKLEASRAELARGNSEVDRVNAEKSSAEAMSRGLLSQLQAADAARGEYRRQRDALELSNIELEKRNIDMNDRVNELTARVDVQLEQKRQYEQQLNILRGENQKLQQQVAGASVGVALEHPEGAAMPNVKPINPVAAREIRGTVVDLAGELVTISVGSADGVQKGMVFVIYRNDEYVADVRIDLVQPDRSAGRLLTSKLNPQPGDRVADAVSVSGSGG